MFEKVTERLIELWLWDLEVLSEPWLYIPFLIPALFFVVFMFLKWVFVLCPLWVVPYMALRGLRPETTD